MPAGTREGYRPARWVDGNYTHSFNVYALHQLFPGARFIHVLREVNEAVAALTAPENKESTSRAMCRSPLSMPSSIGLMLRTLASRLSAHSDQIRCSGSAA